jgi:hypothetical protein
MAPGGEHGVTTAKGRVEFLRGTREEAMRQYFGLDWELSWVL